MCTGTGSGRNYERMESPPTLLRSSKASMTTLDAVLVMVTSYLKSTLVYIRQGCVMSTLLFNNVVDWIMPCATENQIEASDGSPGLR